MNIYRINLNLLKVFAILMRERQVSAAAKSLHLTQPAISNSLQQLRDLFQDELLIRGPKKMQPTQKALLLAPQIDQVLTQLETLLFYSDEFEHQTSSRTFNLGMTDYAEYVLLPRIYEQLKKLAPGLSLRVRTYNTFSSEDFEQQKLELGIGVEKKFPKQLMIEQLFQDSPVCVARADHPLFKTTFTLDHYLQAEHLAACVYSDELSRADQALKKINVQRQIKITIPNVLPALQMLSTSNLIGTFSKHLAVQSQEKYQLNYIVPPFEIPGFHIAQIWHRQQENDSGLIWLRSLIKSICEKQLSGYP